MNGVLMAWMLHHSRVKNLVRAIITVMKKTVSQETTNDARKNTSFWVSPGRCDQWWLNLVIGVTNKWKKNFRMSGTSFYELVQDIQPFISPNLISINLRVITAEKKLAINLYYVPKRHWIIYYDRKFVWRGHEYSWFDRLSQYSNKTLHCTSFCR